MASAESGRVAPLTHRTREVAMRLVACLTVGVIPVVANAAQTESQPPSDPQAYCVNRSADLQQTLMRLAFLSIGTIG